MITSECVILELKKAEARIGERGSRSSSTCIGPGWGMTGRWDILGERRIWDSECELAAHVWPPSISGGDLREITIYRPILIADSRD
jgi:hypothetical protein